ncbi:hypothetical protein Cni_G15954 [Canna indica]|uniref:Uncharacterized protein n=1 Tax=Canna indica TaxID=4628 RepID=A0AAQ3QF92_9LILI|nr:hypothetical protein Cni_G15954 [Canna indica]
MSLFSLLQPPFPPSQHLGNQIPAVDGSRCLILFATSASASGGLDGSTRLIIDDIHKLFDGFSQPVKNFPWMIWSFQNINMVVIWSVVEYLSVSLLAVTSLGEMSYVLCP